jgi:uncharacterized repeat protein (TIGR03803 family)
MSTVALLTSLFVAMQSQDGAAASRGASKLGGLQVYNPSLAAFHEHRLYCFQGRPDGAHPGAALIADSAGALYGTTFGGGNSGDYGTVFKMTPSGNSYVETVLYRFLGGSDGAQPGASLIEDSSGALYGTTSSGGLHTALGTVFRLTPNGNSYTESVLYRFSSGSDGANPYAPLIADGSGALYGTTWDGGPTNLGTVFKLAPNGNGYSESVLYSFQAGVDGANPPAALLADSTGALYGTTTYGGTFGLGTVFKLTPNGGGYIESILFSFGGRGTGVYPAAALIADSSGSLYGTTTGSEDKFGTVFKLTPNGNAYNFSVLHVFKDAADGLLPQASLIFDATGSLYGTTVNGGSAERGIVFKLKPNGSGYRESVLHDFLGGNDGANPQAALIADITGALYGTTFYGGVGCAGTVFKLIR